MNFLEICQKVDVLSGIQGMIGNTLNVVGAQAVIVEAVRSGFVDLQEERMSWLFMRRMAEFSMVPDKRIYTPLDAVGPEPDDPPPTAPHDYFGRWQRNKRAISYRIQDPDTQRWSDVYFIEYRYFRDRFMNHTGSGKPQFVTAHEQDDSLIFHPTPNKAYNVQADYFVTPQVLEHPSAIPILPKRFHYLLVYRGLDRVATHYANTGIYSRYALADAKMTGNLYRDQCPDESVVIRAVA